MTDWKAVAGELYMFCVGVVIGRETADGTIRRRLTALNEIYQRSIEANTDAEERDICGQSFMGGATCILPEGHSSPHASGE